jgi:predicted RNase H-like HicB family nuclease
MTSADYLSRPYARRLTPDESGGYVATIQEFPGLVAEGDSAQEALESLERAAASWIEASLETGRDIPEPIDFGGHSGKVALRIPRGLHKRAAEMALSEGSSLNQWLTGAIAHYLGSHEHDIYLEKLWKEHKHKEVRK